MKNSKKKKPSQKTRQQEYVKGLEYMNRSLDGQLKFYKGIVQDTFKAMERAHFKPLRMGVANDLPAMVMDIIEHYEEDLDAVHTDREVKKAVLEEVRQSKAEWLKHFGVKQEEKKSGSPFPPFYFTGLSS
jgi:hypothetical protein